MKKRRGRPPMKKRGRPKGSKNKKKEFSVGINNYSDDESRLLEATKVILRYVKEVL